MPGIHLDKSSVFTAYVYIFSLLRGWAARYPLISQSIRLSVRAKVGVTTKREEEEEEEEARRSEESMFMDSTACKRSTPQSGGVSQVQL